MNMEPQKKPVCWCGRARRSSFHHLCDVCFGMLPWSIRQPLARHAIHTTAGQELKLKAEEWLKAGKAEQSLNDG
jgi:hypothetical protein